MKAQLYVTLTNEAGAELVRLTPAQVDDELENGIVVLSLDDWQSAMEHIAAQLKAEACPTLAALDRIAEEQAAAHGVNREAWVRTIADCSEVTETDEVDRRVKPAPRFEVQHNTYCQSWTNTWLDNDNGPITYATREQAEAALAEFLSEIAEEIASGEREEDNGYGAEDFRVVEVGHGN
jgi:hypothetical protein